MKLCRSCQICDEALQICQKPTIRLSSRQQALLTGKVPYIFILGGNGWPGRRFSRKNHGSANKTQIPVAKAIKTDKPQLLFSTLALTSTAYNTPTIAAKITISPSDWT